MRIAFFGNGTYSLDHFSARRGNRQRNASGRTPPQLNHESVHIFFNVDPCKIFPGPDRVMMSRIALVPHTGDHRRPITYHTPFQKNRQTGSPVVPSHIASDTHAQNDRFLLSLRHLQDMDDPCHDIIFLKGFFVLPHSVISAITVFCLFALYDNQFCQGCHT